MLAGICLAVILDQWIVSCSVRRVAVTPWALKKKEKKKKAGLGKVEGEQVQKP